MWEEKSAQREPLLSKNSGTNSYPHERDPGFKGIKEEGRKCNDVLFAVIFLLTIGAMVSISLIGFIRGNPSILLPTDEYAQQVQNKAEYWFQDSVAIMKRDVWVIAGGLGFAFVLAVAWVQLMRWFTKLFIYLTLILGVSAVIACGVYFLHTGIQKESSSLKITSYAIFGVAGLLVVITFFLRKKIALTSALFAECCKGFQHNPTILLVGGLVFLFLAAFTAFWVAQFLYLYSIPSDASLNDEVNFPIKTPNSFNTRIRNLLYFQVFVYFWVSAFLSGAFQVAVAGGMASWYFSRDLNYRPTAGSPSLKSLLRAFTLSFGSIAIGSLLLAVVKFINFMLTITKKANMKNRVAVFIISCIQCLLSCVTRIVQFIDRFAYIYIAMHGESFFTSAKNACDLVSRNMFSAVVVDFLGEFVLFVGKLLGTAGTTLLTVGVINHMGRPISPVTVSIVAVVAYRVFSLFSAIVHVGVDTVMVCYMEDLERNKEGALYMSPELHHMLQEKKREKNSSNINQ